MKEILQSAPLKIGSMILVFSFMFPFLSDKLLRRSSFLSSKEIGIQTLLKFRLGSSYNYKKFV